LHLNTSKKKQQRDTIRVIGLTGGIATGKSSVANFLEELGLRVIDADMLSREAVKPGSLCLASIVEVFGRDIISADGVLDRKRLGMIVFSDPQKRKLLEDIIHPEIRRLAIGRIAAAAAEGQSVVFYMAPLLIEAGAKDLVDEIWVVSASPEVQLERVMCRDGISREQAERIIAAQMPLKDKECFGQIVIDNSGTSDELRNQLLAVLDKEFASYSIGERH
jgi:dephospho-CoA kinase